MSRLAATTIRRIPAFLLILLGFVVPLAAAQDPSSYPTGSNGNYSSCPPEYAEQCQGGGDNGAQMQAQCEAAGRAMQQEMEALGTSMQQEQQAFFESFEAKYDEWGQGNGGSDSDWENFTAARQAEMDAFGQQMEDRFDAAFDVAKAKFQEQCPGADLNEGGSGGPGMPPECQGKMEAMMKVGPLMMQKFGPRFQPIFREFDTDRVRFAKENHSPQEWEAWGQQWDAKITADFASLKQDMEATLEELGVRDCFLAMGGWDMARIPDVSEFSGGRDPTQGKANWPGQQGYSDAQRQSREQWDACIEAAGGDEASCRAQQDELFKTVYQDDYVTQQGNCTVYSDPGDGTIVVAGTNHAMQIIPQAQMFVDVRIRGQPTMDKLFFNGYVADWDVESSSDGVALTYYDGEGGRVMQMFDAPNGVTNFHTTPTIDTVTLDLLDSFDLEQTPEGVTFRGDTFGGGVTTYAGSIEVKPGNVLKIRGDATFFANPPVTDDTSYVQEYAAAALAHDIAADVLITEKDGKLEADPVVFGDVSVQVEKAADASYTATVESESEDGQTVVLKFDPEALQDGDVTVTVEEASGEALTTTEASSLSDVLDPDDDGAGAEYWVVEDAAGTQVLVSVPHFSAKKITVQGVEAESSATPGLGVAAVLVALMAGVALAVVARARNGQR